MKKTIFLLNIGNYAPELTALTYPFIYRYAEKIGAGVHIINERKFSLPENGGWDLDYEKLQIYELSQKLGNDWNIYIDSDALVHPELPDITELIPMDTVAHNGSDFGNIRWRYDNYFRRDGRHIGSCNWLACASAWCIDLWKPLEDLTMQQASANIKVTVEEANSGVIKGEHLVSDYTLSRNIARYGLKFTTLNELWKRLGMPDANFFYHQYTVPVEQKIADIKTIMAKWGLSGDIWK